MKNAPTQQAVKALLDDLIPHGARQKQAALMNISPGDWSHRLNPFHERKLATAEGLREQRAMFLTCPEEFNAFRAFIEAVWDSWEQPAECVDAGDFAKESAEAIAADVKGAPIHVQRKEYAQAVSIGKRKLVQLDLSIGLRRAG